MCHQRPQHQHKTIFCFSLLFANFHINNHYSPFGRKKITGNTCLQSHTMSYAKEYVTSMWRKWHTHKHKLKLNIRNCISGCLLFVNKNAWTICVILQTKITAFAVLTFILLARDAADENNMTIIIRHQRSSVWSKSSQWPG